MLVKIWFILFCILLNFYSSDAKHERHFVQTPTHKKLSKYNHKPHFNKRDILFENRSGRNIRCRKFRRDIGIPLYLSVNPDTKINNNLGKHLSKNSLNDQIILEQQPEIYMRNKADNKNKNQRNTNETLPNNNTLDMVDVLINDLYKLRGGPVATKEQQENKKCAVAGAWSSEAGGVVFDISTIKDHLQVDIYPGHPASAKEHSILNINWKVSGLIPFGVNSTMILTAIDSEKGHIAVFVGQCRTCEGTQSITGEWLLNYGTKDCIHSIIGEAVIGDIFTRTSIPNV